MLNGEQVIRMNKKTSGAEQQAKTKIIGNYE